jgi:hypothetical protein
MSMRVDAGGLPRAPENRPKPARIRTPLAKKFFSISRALTSNRPADFSGVAPAPPSARDTPRMDADDELQIAPGITRGIARRIARGIEAYPEAGPFWTGLWAVARHWVALLEDIFEPDVIAGPGITRSFALHCRKWLWSIEGLLRRLIIAAAQGFDPARLAPARTRAPRPAPAPAPASCIAFAVLPRIPGRRLAPAAAHPGRPPAEHRHMFFSRR